MAKDRDAIESDAATFMVLEIYRARQPSQCSFPILSFKGLWHPKNKLFWL
jgi:hypothetical protein